MKETYVHQKKRINTQRELHTERKTNWIQRNVNSMEREIYTNQKRPTKETYIQQKRRIYTKLDLPTKKETN